jgi:predicted esterase
MGLRRGPDIDPGVAHLATVLPGVEARFFEDEGHSIRERHIVDIHAWLIERSF